MSLKCSRPSKPLKVCITGSSQGIGLAAAKQLVAAGHTVYHANRSQARAELAVELSGGGIPVVCDLADLSSVRKCAESMPSNLDVLCLNAGVAPSTAKTTTPPRLTAQGYEECIGVNHLGHFLLASLLYPKFQRLVITASSVHDPEAPGGRSNGGVAGLGDLSGLGVNLKETPDGAVQVDGSTEFSGAKVYKDSKLCNVLFMKEAARRWKDVTVLAFNPGFMPTTGLFDSLRNESPIKAHLLTFFAWAAGISVPVETGGDRLVTMITTTNLPSGTYYAAAPTKSRGVTPEEGFVATTASKEASDASLAAQLWEKSAEILKEWMS